MSRQPRPLHGKVATFLANQSVDESALRRCLVHNDLAPKHSRFLRNGKVYFFDFADRGLGPVSWDLAGMIGSLYWSADISFRRWEHLRNLFLEAYLWESSLPRRDQAAITPMMLSQLIGTARYLNLISSQQQRDMGVQENKRRYWLMEYLLSRPAASVPAVDTTHSQGFQTSASAPRQAEWPPFRY